MYYVKMYKDEEGNTVLNVPYRKVTAKIIKGDIHWGFIVLDEAQIEKVKETVSDSKIYTHGYVAKTQVRIPDQGDFIFGGDGTFVGNIVTGETIEGLWRSRSSINVDNRPWG